VPIWVVNTARAGDITSLSKIAITVDTEEQQSCCHVKQDDCIAVT